MNLFATTSLKDAIQVKLSARAKKFKATTPNKPGGLLGIRAKPGTSVTPNIKPKTT